MAELPGDIQPDHAAADDKKIRSHVVLPHLPRSLAGLPQVLEIGFLSKGVRARPETMLLVPQHLALPG